MIRGPPAPEKRFIRLSNARLPDGSASPLAWCRRCDGGSLPCSWEKKKKKGRGGWRKLAQSLGPSPGVELGCPPWFKGAARHSRRPAMKHGFRVLDSDLLTMGLTVLGAIPWTRRSRSSARFTRHAEGAPNQPVISVGKSRSPRVSGAHGGGGKSLQDARSPATLTTLSAHSRGYDARTHMQAMDIVGHRRGRHLRHAAVSVPDETRHRPEGSVRPRARATTTGRRVILRDRSRPDRSPLSSPPTIPGERLSLADNEACRCEMTVGAVAGWQPEPHQRAATSPIPP